MTIKKKCQYCSKLHSLEIGIGIKLPELESLFEEEFKNCPKRDKKSLFKKLWQKT